MTRHKTSRIICCLITFVLLISIIASTAYAKILNTNAKYEIPKLTIVGNRWPCSKSELQNAWIKYYPLMVQILGEPCKDIKENGLVWKMTDETLDRSVNETFPQTNTVEMGIQVASRDKQQCISGLIHETGHLWQQVNDEAVTYNFGQWIWEASTIIVERILQNEGLEPSTLKTFGAEPVDLYNLMGYEGLNGVQADGDKVWRGNVDLTASNCIYYMNTVLSTPGTYDYWKKVYAYKQSYAEKNNTSIITKTEFMGFLDKAAGKKTIDGMKPSKWLFSRAVSNVKGKDGVYLNVWGNYQDNFGHDVRVNLYGFTRKQLKESSLKSTNVKVNVYDAKNVLKGKSTFKLNQNSIVEKGKIKNLKGKELGTDAFSTYSAIRYVAVMNVKGKTIAATNYSVILPQKDNVKANDNRMFLILIDSKGKIVSNLAASKIKITGATSKNTKYMKNGLLILSVKQGKTVDVTVNSKKYKLSKPAGTRIVPIKVK